MKFRKIVFFTVMLLVICCVTVVSADGLTFEENVLRTIGIIDDVQDRTVVTRRQICLIALRMMGHDTENLPAGNLPFSDVSQTDENSAAFAAAYGLGLISGNENGEFLPDEAIDYWQLVKIIVNVLGYNNHALEKGGYPYGYMTVAQELGITRGIVFDYSVDVTWDTMCSMLYKAVNTDLCAAESLVNLNGEVIENYVVKEGETVLSKYLGFEIGEGVVTANYATALDSPISGLRANELKINGIKYQTISSGFDDYLGYRVKYCYKTEDEPDSIPIIYCVSINERKNRIETYAAECIDSYEADTNTYTVFENGKRKIIEINGGADIIYNGVSCAEYGAEEMKITAGEVIFIDNNTDGIEDVVVVNNPKTYVVNGINRESGEVYFKNTSELLMLDAADNDNVIRVVGEEQPFDIMSLNEWDVLSVAKSKNTVGRICYVIYKGGDSAAGEITGLDLSYETIICSGETYKIAKDFADCLINNPNYISLKNGDFVTLYMNYWGEVAYIDADVGKNYAVLLDIAKNDDLDADVKVRLMLSSGEIRILTCAKNMYLNEQKMTAQQFYDNRDSLMAYNFRGLSTMTVRQLVTYVLSAKGDFLKLSTYSGFSSQIQSLYKRSDIFGCESRLKSTTPIFVIPEDNNINTDDIEDYFTVKTISDYHSDTAYNLEFYDKDDVLIADVAVEYTNLPDQAESVTDSSLMVLTKITKALNMADEEVIKVTGVINNRITNLFVDEKVHCENYSKTELADYSFKEGDVIAYGLNSSGYIKSVRVLLTGEDSENKKEFYVFGSSGRFDSLFMPCAGIVDEYKNNSDMVISTNGIKIAASVANAVITVYDAKSKQAYAGNFTDIAKGDYVVCRFRYGTARDIIIIRNASN